MNKKGFTLIELMVAISIISVLAAILTPVTNRLRDRSRLAAAASDLKNLEKAVAMLFMDTGKFPNGCPPFRTNDPEVNLNTSQAGILLRPPQGAINANCGWTADEVAAWAGPYMKGELIDPWGRDYWFDPDYAFCRQASYPAIATCNPDDVTVMCRNACGGALDCVPPAILSVGPDHTWYSCDDIIIHMRAL